MFKNPKNQTIPKVYKNKKINEANFSDFNLNDYQVFLHLLTKLGCVDERGKYLQKGLLHREHVLTAKDFNKQFNVDLKSCYIVLKNACKKLMKTSIVIDKPERNSKKEINVCSSAEYIEREGRINIKFTDDIMPYLVQAKEKFMLYNLKEVSNFGSLYTTRLYELIVQFKYTGWVQKTVDELRSMFAISQGKFKLYADLKRKTFQHAVNEINHTHNLDLIFEEVKDKRKVVAIKFMFKKSMHVEQILVSES